jgi:N-acyl homoserine lactone hydrolase
MGAGGSTVRVADLAQLPQTDALPTVAETKTTPSGIRIVALRTGWVGVKRTHRELGRVPRGLALPAILFGRTWAAWMPILCYAIVHPTEGTVLVDTGPAPNVNEPDYYAPDPNSAFFYQRNLRFHVPPGDTLAPRLAEAGIAPASVRALVLTHLHGDHVGGVDIVAPHATTYVGPGNWPTHLGAFTARLPAGFAPVTARYQPRPKEEQPAAAGTAAAALDDLFPDTHALTADGTVRIVPLPGHTPGHAGVAVVDGGRVWLIAGDATFDVDQTHRCGVCGISQDVRGALVTQRRLATLLQRAPSTVLLPAHDPDAPARLHAS